MTASTDRLIALFLAALCTGVYLCTFLLCIRWTVFTDEGWHIRKHIRRRVVGASVLIAVFSTIHTVLAVTTSITLVREAESMLSIALGEPNSKLPWQSLVMCTVVNVSILIIDTFLIYRCWIVSSYNKLAIIIPVLFWIGGLVCTIIQLYWQIVQTVQIHNVWTPVNMSLGPGTILTPFWGCTIAVNVYSTSVIVYHIWRAAHDSGYAGSVLPFSHPYGKSNAQDEKNQSQKEIHTHRQSRSQSQGLIGSVEDAETLGGVTRNCSSESTHRDSAHADLRFILRVLLESGALYLVITVPHFAAWFTTSELAIVALGWMNLPIVGTAFNLILVRTAQRRAASEKRAESESALLSRMKFEQRASVTGLPPHGMSMRAGNETASLGSSDMSQVYRFRKPTVDSFIVGSEE